MHLAYGIIQKVTQDSCCFMEFPQMIKKEYIKSSNKSLPFHFFIFFLYPLLLQEICPNYTKNMINLHLTDFTSAIELKNIGSEKGKFHPFTFAT